MVHNLQGSHLPLRLRGIQLAILLLTSTHATLDQRWYVTRNAVIYFHFITPYHPKFATSSALEIVNDYRQRGSYYSGHQTE